MIKAAKSRRTEFIIEVRQVLETRCFKDKIPQTVIQRKAKDFNTLLLSQRIHYERDKDDVMEPKPNWRKWQHFFLKEMKIAL